MMLCRAYAGIPVDTAFHGNLKFEENKGQWNTKVLYMTDFSGGRLFLEKNAFTYALYNPGEVSRVHDAWAENRHAADTVLHCHSFKMNFVNANPDLNTNASGKISAYRNYFIGSDSAKWASYVALYSKVSFDDLYRGIDLNVYSSDNNLEYEFVVNPGTDPSVILMSYDGIDDISIENNSLYLKTSLSEITEYCPHVYQLIDGKYFEVKCNYVMNDKKQIAFNFPEAYNKKFPLIIDPVIIASTYSGSIIETFGHSATYDTLGNIYTGGLCFGLGYPVTIGAYHTTFTGGNVDMVVSKLNPSGSAYIYSTYIGGTGDEFPQSLITDYSGNLYIYGSTGSPDYPVTAGCYDNSYNGNYDIILTKLNPSGSALLGSTYLGGTGDDGYNSIYLNYGDHYRGEIILDDTDNPVIASFSNSAAFPTTAGSYDPTYNNGQDGIVFKMNSNLTAMIWGTFLGADGDDAAFGLATNSTGEIYVVGSTAGGFPTTASVITPSYQGGSEDGFILSLSANGAALGVSTYIGTSSFDAFYFVDFDDEDNVYVFGLSEGAYPVTPGVYSSPGSNGRLIIKLDPALSSVIYSTTFGAGQLLDNVNEFSPTAFMVDICQNVYAAGWGNTGGFPVTQDALQPTTDNEDFYLLVLKKDAISLLYATFYGDQFNVEDHVDGGTSRFDKKGIVYEAVCSQGNNFPTSSFAVSQTNQTGGSSDLAVFKIDFQLGKVFALADVTPNDTGCVPFTVDFLNNSNGEDYFWDFGDGTTSTLESPSHTYTVPGSYQVMFIAIDSLKCNIADTMFLNILAQAIPVIDLGGDTVLCPGDSLLLDAGSPAATHLWSTGETTQMIWAADSGMYWVQVDNDTCQAGDTIMVDIPVINPLAHDTTVCENTALLLDAGSAGTAFLWSTGETTQTITADSTGIYWVDISLGICSVIDSIDVTIEPVPLINLGNDTLYCQSVSAILDAGNPGCTYQWSTGANTQTISVDSAGTFWVEVSNGLCNEADTINITAVYPPDLGNDVTMCEQGDFLLDAGPSHGVYLWSTGDMTQTIAVTEPGVYWVLITDAICSVSDTIVIEKGGSYAVFFPNTFTPDADGMNDVFKGYGEEITYYDLTIFTRWGQQIFRTTDPETAWDGTFEGVKVQQGVYTWMADYKTTCTGWNVQHKLGHVLVLR
jgi:gliding motility-associated-like protein